MSSFDDLVSYWNLRAADIPLWFVDPNHLGRYAEMIPAWEKVMREAPCSVLAVKLPKGIPGTEKADVQMAGSPT